MKAMGENALGQRRKDNMSLERQPVDLKNFLESEIPRERLSSGLRMRLEDTLESGASLREVAVEVVEELVRHGILRQVGRLRRGNESIPLWSVEGSPRAFDLRRLLVPGHAEARGNQLQGASLSSSPGPSPPDLPLPPESQESLPAAAGIPPSAATLSAGARRTLEAIRGTFQRDWVSFGLDASLENLLAALRESLGDPSLHLLLWADRLPLQTGGGVGWELVDQSHRLALNLMASGGGVIPAQGRLVEGKRWRTVWLGETLVGALGADPSLDPVLGEEASGAVRDLIAAASRSQHRVFTDPLTGVHNRGFFDRQFAMEIERSRRSGAPLALLFADIDHFKRTNDEHGHDVGDTVLRHLASLLVAHLRRIDYVFRYGGEEFALLLPGTDLQEASHTAERLCEQIAATPVRLPDGRELHVTLSIGVAVFPEHGEDERVLLRRADLAMHQAKQSGRNRVAIWGTNGS